jgi:hypothetical protein
MRLDTEAQYQRLLRSYKKLHAIGTDMGSTTLEMGGTDARDTTHAFFNDCQTFKNWLKKDPRVLPIDVEKHVSSSRALSLVVNVRHALEHALPKLQTGSTKVRTRAQAYRIDVEWIIDLPGTRPLQLLGEEANLDFYRGTSLIGRVRCCAATRIAGGDRLVISRNGPLAASTGRTITSSRLILVMGGKEYNALQLAEDCISEWRTFLTANRISFAEE